MIEMDQFQRSILKYFCERQGVQYLDIVREIEHDFQQRGNAKKRRNIAGAQVLTERVQSSSDDPETPTINKEDWSLELGFIHFAPSIPSSSIVHSSIAEMNSNAKYQEVLDLFNDDAEKQKLVEFRLRAYEIYKKYVEVGSIFEINVSSRCRQTCICQLSDFDAFVMENFSPSADADLLTLFQLFGPSLYEMHQLLIYSFNRFRTNAAYDRLVETMQAQ